ncbi:MAG TPA: marine proteobacterial sortase target protein [Rhodanobacteraceae bacterium]|nr:marine proteobacterial sortase target protein [Rhodanobacteraceae bacterium]
MKLFSKLAHRRAALWMLLAIASGLACAGEPGSGELRLLDKAGQVHEMASLDTRVDYRVNGLVAEVAVHQRFQNTSQDWLEGQYLLPLPEGAAVYGMTVHIGARVIVGEVKEKQAARQAFQQASQQGRKAALVEADGANLFRTAVTNVAPGEAVEVELHYWQRVDYAAGRFSLRFPLTYTPRYHAHIGTTSEAADPGVTGPEAFATAKAEPPLATQIHIALDAGVPLATVESPSHAIVSSQHDGRWTVQLRDASVLPDRDFVLRWTPAPSSQPNVAAFSQTIGDAHYAMLMMLPPQQDARRLPRELILVIDTSGSMGGESIRQARKALDLALTQLQPSDRFNVVEFNSIMRPWQKAAVPASADNVATARRWVAALEATGGTEMAPALAFALQGHAPQGYVRQVVFATDGAVDNPAGLMAIIDQQLGDSRLFPIGIGSAPNADFMSAAAIHGRGSETIINDLSQLDDAMRGLLAKLDHPAMRDLAIDWPAGSEAWPKRLPDLYAGEPLLTVAKLPADTAQVQVHGKLADRDWTAPAKLDHARPATGLDKLWAHAKIADLEDRIARGEDETALKPAIVQTALAAHLVSRYTSLVAVDKTPARPSDAKLAHTQVPNVMPHGTVFAQTATPARLELLLALLSLFGAALMWRAGRAAA